MSTVAYAKNGSATVGFPAKEYLKSVGVISVLVDLSKATSIKGSALIATDVIQVINLPPNTLILGGAVENITAPTGGTSTLVSVGVTGISAAGLIDVADLSTVGMLPKGTNGQGYGWAIPWIFLSVQRARPQLARACSELTLWLRRFKLLILRFLWPNLS